MTAPSSSDDLTVIVVENGSSWTRVGYSGETLPRHILPTHYGKDGSGKLRFDSDINDPTVANQEVYSPVIDGCVQDWEAMSSQWAYIYREKLGIETSEAPLLTTENVWNPSVLREKMLEVVFEKLEVPIFGLVKSPLCATYQNAQPTALVIDIGSSTASVTPVVDGTISPKTAVHSRFAGDFLDLHVVNNLKSKGLDLSPPFKIKTRKTAENDTVEYNSFPHVTESFTAYQTARTLLVDIKEAICQVSESSITVDSAGSLARFGRPFEFPDGTVTTFGQERFTAAEALFQPLLNPIPGVNLPEEASSQGISHLVFQALSKVGGGSNQDTLSDLLRNIVLVGGTSLLNGLSHRLESDIVSMFPNFQPRLYVPQTATDRKCANWTGASILASLDNWSQPFWITKQEYEEYGAELAEKRFK